MPEPSSPSTPWWHRRLPSFAVFVAVVAVIGLATAVVGRNVVHVLPEVGKDHLGSDAWSEPLGIEKGDGLNIARLPECAAGSITRIVLWDPESKPYWEVSGPATAMTAFFVGLTPKGFTVITPYREPPPGSVLRLVAFRQEGEVAGIRYKASDLRKGRVVSGNPLARYTVAGFQDAKVCSDSAVTPTTLDVDGDGAATDLGVPTTVGG
ncbi:hypothetical protein KSP35_10845 [Aquihabitans sp. G128]|uniref:hypothetical protein n=1 Tax=Aquihabitans sp. G128 TaxID=2849779 RepID=UPI001C22C454|nr:hypothetical protein [Aquihabitans sp. G128]QXC63233.1 hypothetical protein KSP35_10845 [Aquihabitans sp. G128]